MNIVDGRQSPGLGPSFLASLWSRGKFEGDDDEDESDGGSEKPEDWVHQAIQQFASISEHADLGTGHIRENIDRSYHVVDVNFQGIALNLCNRRHFNGRGPIP